MAEHEDILELIEEPSHQRQWVIFSLSLSVVILGCLMEVVPGGLVAFRGFESHPLPQSCPTRAWIGLDCAGCGMTRSIIHLLHGRWDAGMEVHRFGWLMLLAILAQIPYRLKIIYGENPLPLGWLFPRLFGWGLLSALLINWGLRIWQNPSWVISAL